MSMKENVQMCMASRPLKVFLRRPDTKTKTEDINPADNMAYTLGAVFPSSLNNKRSYNVDIEYHQSIYTMSNYKFGRKKTDRRRCLLRKRSDQTAAGNTWVQTL